MSQSDSKPLIPRSQVGATNQRTSLVQKSPFSNLDLKSVLYLCFWEVLIKVVLLSSLFLSVENRDISLTSDYVLSINLFASAAVKTKGSVDFIVITGGTLSLRAVAGCHLAQKVQSCGKLHSSRCADFD